MQVNSKFRGKREDKDQLRRKVEGADLELLKFIRI
jgi:hypothetical protein